MSLLAVVLQDVGQTGFILAVFIDREGQGRGLNICPAKSRICNRNDNEHCNEQCQCCEPVQRRDMWHAPEHSKVDRGLYTAGPAPH